MTPSYVTEFTPDRELPVIARIARGSLFNKLVILLPAALLLSAFLPGAITPLLMAGGAPGKRYSLPHSRMMIHQPLGGFQGQASDIDIHAREILAVRDRLNRILAHHTGQPIEKIAGDTDRDNFMSGPDAVNYGLIDKVLERRVA